MTLAEMIQQLKTYPPETVMRIGLSHPHSYRGDCFELAFEPSHLAYRPPSVTVGDLLKEAESCVGRAFDGYKGGEYTMDESTNVYAAEWGDSGTRLDSLYLHCLITGAIDGYEDHRPHASR